MRFENYTEHDWAQLTRLPSFHLLTDEEQEKAMAARAKQREEAAE